MDAAKHLTAGTIAGVVAKSFEYPFDTIKVRVQARPDLYSGYVDCVKKMMGAEGISGFYRGVMAPVIGAGAENAVCFFGFSLGLKAVAAVTNYQGDIEVNTPLSATVAAGMISGVAVSHVLTPVELLKCTMQVEHLKPKAERQYHGVIDVATQMIRKEGFSSLFKGHTATLLREIPGNGAWFLCYNLALRAQLPAGATKEDLPGWRIALAGGCGGVMYWTAFFPADVVKTRMQLEPEFLKNGFIRGFQHQYRHYGLRKGLYAGWSITAARAFPSNAIIFFTYEKVAAAWREKFERKQPPPPAR